MKKLFNPTNTTLPLVAAALLASQLASHGALTVSVLSDQTAFNSSGTDLTVAGSADWFAYTGGGVEQKASSTLISFTTGTTYADDASYPGFSWTDGSPTAVATGQKGVNYAYNPSITVTIPAGVSGGTLLYWTGRGDFSNVIWEFDMTGDSGPNSSVVTFDPTADRNLFTVNFSDVPSGGAAVTATLTGLNSGDGAAFAAALSTVPEPSSALALIGSIGIFCVMRRRGA